MFIEKDLVQIARRENNSKRKYLVVNRMQGKHVPVLPSAAMGLFRALADIVNTAFEGEKLLIIGFAETATAIGAAVACSLDCDYIQTTREIIENADYLYFSEAHSHATEQKLVKNDIDRVIDKVDRIVFVEDEITTGNTIMNIVEIMEKEYGKQLVFSAASLLNGMDKEAMQCFENKGISFHYLVKTDHSSFDEVADHFDNNGEYWTSASKRQSDVCWTKLHHCADARRLVKSREYHNACSRLWEDIHGLFPVQKTDRILVLGTEEFMYPALYTAERLEEIGCCVRFHATTRSPIMTNIDPVYPLHKRYELKSLYDSERTTFIYELSSYDKVFVISDTMAEDEIGKSYLQEALETCNNQTIYWIRWCRD